MAGLSFENPLKRAVITGMGVCTPLGMSLSALSHAVLNALSSITMITRFDASMFHSELASSFDLHNDPSFLRNRQSWFDRGTHLLMHALEEALKNAHLNALEDRERISVIVGSSHSGIESAEQLCRHFQQDKTADIDKRVFLSSLIDQPASVTCRKLRALGIKLTFSSACASSNTAIGVALDLINDDLSDIVIVGGTDTISLSILAGFSSLSAVSKSPTAPFSNPLGLSLGEGAGVIVVENLAHALKRGARLIAEILGYGLSGDAYHETAPDIEGLGVSSAISSALVHSGLRPDQIDYVSAHGTGTEANDAAEIKGTVRVIGNKIPISSSKSFIGHTLGASGVLEAIITLLCVEQGYVPHTKNFRGPRDSCPNLNYVPNVPQKMPVRFFLNNNFGFGGNNSSVIIGQVQEKFQ
jgi:3-oxoacyl-[acyl-carrier-protein] synthase II